MKLCSVCVQLVEFQKVSLVKTEDVDKTAYYSYFCKGTFQKKK